MINEYLPDDNDGRFPEDAPVLRTHPGLARAAMRRGYPPLCP